MDFTSRKDSLTNTEEASSGANPVLDSRAHIAIVHTNQVMRSTICKIFKDDGYLNVQAFSELSSLKEYLETESIDWVWSPLMLAESVNLLQFLELVCATESLRALRISAFIEESEMAFAPVAFELGLFSWHKAPKNAADCKQEIRNALNLLSKHAYETTLGSADQLEKLLARSKQTQARQKLFSALSALYPNKPFAVLGHAAAEFETGNKSAGMRSLQLAKSQSMSGWKELAEKYLGTADTLSQQRVFDIDSYVIVEPDETVHNHIEALMKPFGAKKVHRFTDGEKALRFLQNRKPPDLIIQEWKIPDVSGPGFLQRVRHLGVQDVPVLVVSSLLKKTDLSILKEMGVASTVQKPLIDHEFISSLTQTLNEFADPKSFAFIERKVKRLLENEQRNEALLFMRQTNQDKALPQSTKSMINALFCYHEGSHTRAKDFLIECLNEGGDPLRVLPLLARTLVRLRDFSSAAKCYEKAQSLSPQNIYRLFELAETYHELGQDDGVNSSLKRAQEIDPSNPEINVMKARIALSKGNTREAAPIVQSLQNKQTLIADLNNAGVTFVKTGETQRGIDLYEKTLAVLGNSEPNLSAKVRYNLALAQAKQGNYPLSRKSLEVFLKQHMNKDSATQEKSTEESENWERLILKAKSLHVRLSHAISTGTTLGMKTSRIQTPSLNDSFWKRMEGTKEPQLGWFRYSANAKPGERCCHLLYSTPAELKRKLRIHDLLKDQLNFSPRSKLEKATKDSSVSNIDFEGFDSDL